MERWDLYRRDGTRTGQTIQNGEQLPSHLYSLLVHIIICNHENKFLIQQRSFQKQYFPGIWDITGGRVQAGETGPQGAIREAAEEVGLHFEEKQLTHVARTVTPWNNLFDIYFVKATFTFADCQKQDTEVEQLALLPYDEMLRLLKKDEWYRGVLADVAQRIGIVTEIPSHCV